MEKDVRALKKELLVLCWNMRGGVSYEDIIEFSITERRIISDIIENNIETTNKTGYPYF